MNGYLMQEMDFRRGQDVFVESASPENRYAVVFEDDGETGYFYAVEKDAQGDGFRILDALHIYEVDPEDPETSDPGTSDPGTSDPDSSDPDSSDPDSLDPDSSGPVTSSLALPDAGASDPAAGSRMLIIWSRDWLKCALVIDGYCHAVFDFEAQGGYNIDEFPPPNETWTKGERKLSDEIVRKYF